ncbi:MAG: peptidoglycan editing factor PgeF [Chloroflexi bacterium]|nr:peptidoglycan editing factor PgeF [Chloroflexota bacterium]MBU1750174.1 peptidoglycan editing factor PgeF [Chloroflexota bacterium]MBU1880118.1 peptidoglycan editing factor PgeF [Chloroflexota bacterium]
MRDDTSTLPIPADANGPPALIRRRDNGLLYYQFQDLSPFPELVHGIFGRLGGVSPAPFASLNVSLSVGDERTRVVTNRARLCQTLDVDAQAIVMGQLVHGTRATVVLERHRGLGAVNMDGLPATDILVTDRPGVPLLMTFADCVPLILYDPVRRVIGLAHGGWRGTLLGVARSAVRAMQEAFGCRPGHLIAAIGPAVGPCCYQVGQDVRLLAQESFPNDCEVFIPQADGSWHLDLWQATRHWLTLAGVQHIAAADWCTACHTHEFFSHRGENGRTGRFGVVLALQECGP